MTKLHAITFIAMAKTGNNTLHDTIGSVHKIEDRYILEQPKD